MIPDVDRAAALAARKIPAPLLAYGLKITVVSMRSEGPHLFLELAATRDGVPETLDNPFVFTNPPTQNEKGVEDPDGSLVEMITQVIRVTQGHVTKPDL